MDQLSPRGQGEPTTVRGRETKARIVAAAAELMYKRGVAATSVDDVLAAAGVGKSQFYHYFSAKTELVEAVLHLQLDRVLRDQKRFDIGTWDGIQAWLDSMLAQQESRGFSGGCPVGSLVAEVADQDDRLRTVAAAAFARWEGQLAAGLRALQDQGGLRADADPEALAEEVLASIQGGYLLSTAKRAARPMRNAMRAAFARLRSHAD
ncbi:MAG: TetR/AcrR family transcriptional regulator [Actinomycetota bacterium]|nr:TetR/AcrR family transcriptional regulator [Actinomycetota bacterium]